MVIGWICSRDLFEISWAGLLFLGGGVPPGPENPYPISDQNIRFSTPYFRPDSQNAYPTTDKMYTLFQTKCIPYFRRLSMDLRCTGLCDAPNDVQVFFSS